MLKNITYKLPDDNYSSTYNTNPSSWYGICLLDKLFKNKTLEVKRFDKILFITFIENKVTVFTDVGEKLVNKIVDNIVFVWYSENQTTPFFDIPSTPELNAENWTTLKSFRCTFRTHIQELRENFCDASHFTVFHGQKLPPTTTFTSSGYTGEVRCVLKHTYLKWLKFESVGTMYGPGLMVVRLYGIINAAAYVLTTPIDTQFSELRFFATAQKPRFAIFLAHFLSLLILWIAYKDLKKEGIIWNHKVYVKNALILPHERAILEFRKWYRQFYPQ